ncbi:arsenate reductase (thioredoxin) [Leuconostoc fallax]|uniref:arsenate reductase (thioredoxin) n=1 Tax=Leuconostoc fallax TaxID=1251 RepID=UPI0020909754|nr:arsenate reductase (thioredoxin) [Leuconostoc fallax]MCO6183205.1 arsenate reductase (thioredoxin) [Leuconostoc fallax]
MKIYFLCTGNSCRSQMAEGFAKDIMPKSWIIKSAGIEQHGLNQRAVSVMAEAGIDISNQTSDLIDDDFLFSCDYVITLCGDANDKCPATPANVKRLHWPLTDPAGATGSEEAIQNQFRKTRDEIKILVHQLRMNLV